VDIHNNVDAIEYLDDEGYYELSPDPDILSINGERYAFEEFNGNVIIQADEVTPLMISRLSEFFEGKNPINYRTTDRTWSRWDELDDGVAYRGGKGYSYTIWEYVG